MHKVYIVGRGLVSHVGVGVAKNLAALEAPETFYSRKHGALVGSCDVEIDEILRHISLSSKHLKYQDRVTLLAVAAAKQAYVAQGELRDCAVIFGASRGPWEKLESALVDFYRHERRPFPHSSPVTTVSALSAAVARECGAHGLSLTVSSACSSGLHAVGLGYATLTMGTSSHALVGGAEAPITPFMIEMLKSARVYASELTDSAFPVKSFHPERSGLVLSEGSGCLLLSTKESENPLGVVKGYGAATEKAGLTGISAGGEVLAQAIRGALSQARLNPSEIDLIVAHGSGTVKGDEAELAALYNVFDGDLPPLCSHKWLLGHSLGASSAMSLVLATEQLRMGKVSGHPYFGEDEAWFASKNLSRRDNALVVSLGFGGNAAALVIGSS
jgi:3-oxoacyl-(acyl-carrier-protein) synthase